MSRVGAIRQNITPEGAGQPRQVDLAPVARDKALRAIAHPHRQLAFGVQVSKQRSAATGVHVPIKSKKFEFVELVADLAIGFLVIRFVEHTFPEQSFLVRLALILLIGMPIGLAVHAVLKFARRAWQRK